VGVIRKLRVFQAVGKAANEVAAASGAPPGMQRGMAAGFANVMQVLTPQIAATAERRPRHRPARHERRTVGAACGGHGDAPRQARQP